MVIYPDVQRKAQAELDKVIGKGRIPDFDEDEESLPYLMACVKESLRWHQVTPLAIAHRLDKDDVYRGYTMPKGALVFGNSWYLFVFFLMYANSCLSFQSRAVLNDPQVYPDPSEFRPERFLGPDGKLDPTVLDPRAAAFGYGRRGWSVLEIVYDPTNLTHCPHSPGIALGISTVWIAGASLLSVFNIERPVDENGKIVEIPAAFTTGFIR